MSMSKDRRSPGMGSVYKRSNGSWVASITLPATDGRQRRRNVTRRSYAEAMKELRKLRVEVQEGGLPGSSTMKVGAWCDHWLEHIRRPHIAPTTYVDYEKAIRLYIKPHIGGKQLRELQPAHVRTMQSTVAKKTSTRAAQKAHRVLHMALTDAVADRVVKWNAAASVRHPKHTYESPKALDLKVVKKILEAAQGDRFASRWEAAFRTGARPGEMIGLEWWRVDLTKGLIDLSWQLQLLKKRHGCDGDCGRAKPGFCPQAVWDVDPSFEMRPCYKSLAWTRPKTSTRIDQPVPIEAGLLEMLKAEFGNQGKNPCGLVWHHEDGRPVAPREDYDLWGELIKRAKVPYAVPYSTRHTAASFLREAGVDEPTRMAILGQSSVVAHRIYVHVGLPATKKGVAQLGALLA